ncbi:hypothetical protein ASG43_11560 [Aureimonas sp. Leaf454]|uniref:DUF2939 domain-containing protein n=1 Tax=Aureimonas sp. Leaf454 TaxID=1736381 RepID=UPI0006F5A0C7|nr:DUF2939 domain-containing protein [Aureimonas sp. Leaf454]KQT46260.1 hypothetical protein ASG43_11560 [Aureimonas sp. Leaf454]
MRRWIVGIGIGTLVAVLYLASPFVGLYRLGSALRSADAEVLLERIDIAGVRRSIVSQIVAEIGRDEEVQRHLDKLGGIGRDMALRAAAGEFDRHLAATVTPEILRLLLSEGRLPPALSLGAAEASSPAPAIGLPDNPLRFLRSWDYVSPRKVRAVIGEAGEPEDWTEVVLFLKGATWRLTEVQLPPSVMARVRPVLKAKIQDLRS